MNWASSKHVFYWCSNGVVTVKNNAGRKEHGRWVWKRNEDDETRVFRI